LQKPSTKIVGMSLPNDEYMKWNIEKAARALVAKPDEEEATMQVYEAHKEILKKRGVSAVALAEGDSKLLKRIYDILDVEIPDAPVPGEGITIR